MPLHTVSSVSNVLLLPLHKPRNQLSFHLLDKIFPSVPRISFIFLYNLFCATSCLFIVSVSLWDWMPLPDSKPLKAGICLMMLLWQVSSTVPCMWQMTTDTMEE